MGIFKRWLKKTWDEIDQPTTPPEPVPIESGEPKWLTIAKGEIGVKERQGGEHPRIIEYHKTTTLKASEDEVAWCSSFVNWVMIRADFKGTNSAAARSWLQWGEKLDKPRKGCIVVFKRGNSSWQGHVAFYDSEFDGFIRVLGGNQSNAVKYSNYYEGDLLGYRWPKGVPASEPVSEYQRLFDTLQIRSDWKARADRAAARVLQGKSLYQSVESRTKIPWHLIGLIHLMESDCDFTTHLHNGDPLTARTVRVPSGRPKTGNPPFRWIDSAVDAIDYDKNKFKQPIAVLANQLESLERFNGMGYRTRGINTPYLWSGCQHYTKGKFISDGKYDPNYVSRQIGAAVVLKVLKNRGDV